MEHKLAYLLQHLRPDVSPSDFITEVGYNILARLLRRLDELLKSHIDSLRRAGQHPLSYELDLASACIRAGAAHLEAAHTKQSESRRE